MSTITPEFVICGTGVCTPPRDEPANEPTNEPENEESE